MRRKCCLILAAFVIIGCQALPDPNRSLQPLPLEGPPLTYREVATRARLLAMTATESFYVDAWADVERSAVSLAETATYLPRSSEVPADQKPSLDARSQSLREAAQKLREAALSRDEKKTNDSMQKINLLVRELRTP